MDKVIFIKLLLGFAILKNKKDKENKGGILVKELFIILDNFKFLK